MLRVTKMLTIGEFSRLTHLPIKTLHHYHDVGLLVPAAVNPATGYRHYAMDQVAVAHLVRRLRDVRMPLDEARAVVEAPDDAAREARIVAHLDRLHRELSETATAVASLRALLAAGPAAAAVTFRNVPEQVAVAVHDSIRRERIGEWCAETFPRLFASMARLAALPSGPGGALYDPGWFEDGGGGVTAFIPVDVVGAAPGRLPVAPGPALMPGRIALVTVPADRLAVTMHTGAFDDLDLTYGLLGRRVLESGLGADGPIRETYLINPADTDDPEAMCTEIGWPLTTDDEPEDDVR